MPDEDQKILPELKCVRFVRSDLCYKYREGSAEEVDPFVWGWWLDTHMAGHRVPFQAVLCSFLLEVEHGT